MVAIWTLVGAITVVVLTLVVVAAMMKRQQDRAALAVAGRLFRIRREWLETEFLAIVSKTEIPGGVSWNNCEFDDEVAYARDRSSGQLCALVAITLRVDDTSGGRRQNVGPLGRFSVGTAVFQFDGEHWSSDGQAIFNMNPREAMRRYRRELEELGEGRERVGG